MTITSAGTNFSLYSFAFMEFDVSSSGVVDEALFSLYARSSGNTGGASMTITVVALTGSIDAYLAASGGANPAPTEASYTARQAWFDDNVVNGISVGTITYDSLNSSAALDVTGIVNQWIGGESRFCGVF